MGLFNLFKKADKKVCETEEKQSNNTNNALSKKATIPTKQIAPNIRGQFDGMLIKVLKEEYQEFGFEKHYKKDCILLRGTRNYYYQTINKEVVSEGNGRPITYYSEYVFVLNTSDINDISMDNILDFCKPEPTFDKTTSEYGVGF